MYLRRRGSAVEGATSLAVTVDYAVASQWLLVPACAVTECMKGLDPSSETPHTAYG
jgi:hypothetical protein